MLEDDNEEAAKRSTRIIKDQRVRQYYDPQRMAGKAIAESLGAPGQVAWDMYLFYSRDIEWGESLPVPFDWAHQLSEAWANPSHFAWGPNLPGRLDEIMSRLTG